MVYPLILMIVAIGAIAIFLIAIVPKFAEIFQGPECNPASGNQIPYCLEPKYAPKFSLDFIVIGW